MFALSFSKRIDGQLIPYLIDGKEATLTVQSESKTSAIYHPDTVKFCEENSTTVRSVT